MLRRALTLTSIVAAALLTITAVPVRADLFTNDKLTFLTFSGKVQVPGATLDAGTYRFHLTDPYTTRKAIQVLSHDGKIVYAQFATLPDRRMTTTKEATVTFRETPAGVPPAIKSLFYGWEHDGYEFFYPKGVPAVVLPELAAQPPITFTPITTAEVTESRSAVTEPAPEPPAVVESAPAAAPAELPKTASAMPLVAFGGLASLILALGTVFVRRFSS